MIQRGLAVCLLLIFAIAPAPASTMEWLSGHQLRRSCDLFLDDPQSQDGALCLAFMQGFIAGADAAEGTVVGESTETSETADESYSERAARTRLGTIRLQGIQAAKLARYCIDENVTAFKVVKKITAYLEDRPRASDLTVYENVREALVHSFPCAK